MGSGQHHESRILRFRRMDCGAGARSSQSPSVVLGENPPEDPLSDRHGRRTRIRYPAGKNHLSHIGQHGSHFQPQPYGTGCPEGCRRNTVGRNPLDLRPLCGHCLRCTLGTHRRDLRRRSFPGLRNGAHNCERPAGQPRFREKSGGIGEASGSRRSICRRGEPRFCRDFRTLSALIHPSSLQGCRRSGLHDHHARTQ